MAKTPRLHPDARVVRRYDSIGRPYYTRVSTGERVKRSSWERDLDRREKERSAALYERARADAEEKERRQRAKEERKRAKEGTRPGRRKPAAPPPEAPAPPPPFPSGVSAEGVPDVYVDNDGIEWEAYEIEGDDDTGGKE